MVISADKFKWLASKYNNAKSEIDGIYIRNGDIYAYHVSIAINDRSIGYKIIEKEAIKLIEEGLIKNCITYKYQDMTLISGKGFEINKLPLYRDIEHEYLRLDSEVFNFNDLRVLARIMDSGDTDRCIGYEVMYKDGSIHNLSKADIIKLTKGGIVSNLELVDIGGKQALRGVGISLSKLPKKISIRDKLEKLG